MNNIKNISHKWISLKFQPTIPPHIKAGFTLIELLVTIVIIALLVGIMMPALGQARVSARRSVCRAQLHEIATAFRVYLNESNDVLPMAAQLPSLEPDMPSIAEVLFKEDKSREVMHCPADNDPDECYFDKEGTSYEYPELLRGKRVDRSFLGKRWTQNNTPVLFDFKTFHNKPGRPGAMNFLFADGHVGEFEGSDS